MPTSPDLPVTHRTSVTEDQIDHLGHMNVRYYGIAARAATGEVVARLTERAGGDAGSARVRVPDVYTRHLREQMLGNELSVRSGVLEVQRGAVRIYHELVNDETGDVAASFVHHAHVDHGPDLTTAEPGDLALAEIPAHGRPRTIDLGAPGEVAGPDLSVVLERNLAVRLPRQVGGDEIGPDGVVRPVDAHLLIWGGTPLQASSGPLLRPGPDGQLIGWATMENRMRLGRLPAEGTRIQSFGAVLSVAEKVTHRVFWAYDLDSKELLCTFEVVDLAFDTVSRRAVPIPDDLRTESLGNLFEDLRPGR